MNRLRQNQNLGLSLSPRVHGVNRIKFRSHESRWLSYVVCPAFGKEAMIKRWLHGVTEESPPPDPQLRGTELQGLFHPRHSPLLPVALNTTWLSLTLLTCASGLPKVGPSAPSSTVCPSGSLMNYSLAPRTPFTSMPSRHWHIVPFCLHFFAFSLHLYYLPALSLYPKSLA